LLSEASLFIKDLVPCHEVIGLPVGQLAKSPLVITLALGKVSAYKSFIIPSNKQQWMLPTVSTMDVADCV
jgi:hypothetical protein